MGKPIREQYLIWIRLFIELLFNFTKFHLNFTKIRPIIHPFYIIIQSEEFVNKLSEIFDDSKYGLSPLSSEEISWLQQENNEAYPDYVEAECPKWLFEKIKNNAENLEQDTNTKE